MSVILITEANKIFKGDILKGNGKRVNVDGRVAVSNYMRINLKMKFHRIGEILNKDHSLIVYYVKSHNDLYKYNSDYKVKYDLLTVVHRYANLYCNPCVYPLKLN